MKNAWGLVILTFSCLHIAKVSAGQEKALSAGGDLIVKSSDTIRVKETSGYSGVHKKDSAGVLTKAKGRLKAEAAAFKPAVNPAGFQSMRLSKEGPVNAELEFGDAMLYHPLSLPFSVQSGRTFANVLSVRGVINAWGVPLNLNYSTDQASSMAGHTGLNNLFNFNYNPGRFNDLLSSEMLRYNDLRRQVFGGKTLSGFVQNAVQQKILKPNSTLNAPKDVLLAKYLNNPIYTTGLLQLNRQQISSKLLNDLNHRQAKMADSLVAVRGQAAMRSLIQSTDEKEVVTGSMEMSLEKLGSDQPGSAYFTDPANIKSLKNLNQEQLAAKIKAYVPIDSIGQQEHSAGLKLGYDSVVNQTAHAMFISLRQKNNADFQGIIKEQRDSLGRKFSYMTGRDLSVASAVVKGQQGSASSYETISPAQADSIAIVVTGIRQQLEAEGVDVNKMIRVESLVSQSGGDLSISELGNNYQHLQPSNDVQSFFSRVQTLKLGAFGDLVPGNTQNRDIFMSGTHFTYKAGTIPVTVGYGSVSDISAFKDAGFQNSIYNQPRSMTFIAGEIPGARGGALKVSVISSYNREFHSSMYATPSISANNVAFTLSKALKFGSLGNVDLDVSKTTTLYNNQNQPGGEAVLDKKAGLANSLSNDLFSALSFGFRHQLTVQELDVTDNLYFNYAGTGYQNPANNGFGGGRTKFGGNIKKSFYNRRLTMVFRTDMTNMPISYTTNDQWKTHQFQLDSRFQVSKKFYIGLKYISNGTDKKIDNAITPVYGFNKIQVDGNATYKIGKYYSISHFTLGKQDFTNTNALQGAGNLFMLNYTQSVLLKKNALTIALFYNKELSAYQLIGNMLNADMSYQYALFGAFRLSSGLTYLDNADIVRQCGFRQGLQFFSGGHFDLDTYIDLRKNMEQSKYPDLYPLCRAELSLKYHFKI